MRIDNGAGGVTYNGRLDAAAQGHADDMVNQTYFSHTSKDGRVVRDRIVEQGYNPIAWGENIARGHPNQADVLEAWQNSDRHNEMMISENLEDFGLGVSGSGSNTRWVLVMATER